jgi:hypothetical protein
MGRRRRRTCTWQFSLIPSSTHTHTHNFWLEYWERDRFTCTVALCTRTEGRAERQMAASKNPSKHSMLPSPPSSFHFDWKTATFYPKKKINSKKSFFPFYNIFLPKNFSLCILFLFLFLCVLFTTDPPYYFFFDSCAAIKIREWTADKKRERDDALEGEVEWFNRL